MKRLLSTVVVLEGLALLAAAGVFAVAGSDLAARPARPAVFRPPILDAVIGERARYRILDTETRRLLGFVTYRVRVAQEVAQMVGRRFQMEMVIEDEHGRRTQTTLLLIDPRSQGWLPPVMREDALPSGEWPVPRLIESTRVRVKGAERPGFRVPAVRPRWSLQEVYDVYWFAEAVPVFGLVRRHSRKGIPGWFGSRPVVWELNDFDRPKPPAGAGEDR
ncbi:MAG: hypothetical protein ACE5JG_08995 [Planctomycetota bacterium]